MFAYYIYITDFFILFVFAVNQRFHKLHNGKISSILGDLKA